MSSYLTNRLSLLAQLKAESANWVGYNSALVDKVASTFKDVAEEADDARKERKIVFVWVLSISLALIVGIGFLKNVIDNDNWRLKKEAELTETITKNISTKYTEVHSGTIYQKDGVLYVKE